eukprot:EG_transcript_14760
MAVETTFRMLSQQGLLPLPPEVGVEALLQVLGRSPAAVVTVCPLDVARLPPAPYYSALRPVAKATVTTTRSGLPSWLAELQDKDISSRRNVLMKKMREVIRDAAGVEDLEESTVWGEAGLDSLGMVEVRNGLARAFENAVPLGATALFDYPTPTALVQHIEATLFPVGGGGGGSVQSLGARTIMREAIALIGMGCHFPGGNRSPEQFWQFLLEGGDGAGEIPIARFDWRPAYDPAAAGGGKLYVNKGAFIEDVHLFDHALFRIPPAEAMRLDPQQRIAMETAYAALVQSGLSLSGTDGTVVGTYAASGFPEFTSFMDDDYNSSPYTVTSTATFTANRLAFVFGLVGPSVMVDTACSSALVAADTACKALLSGDCEAAAVVGVNLMVDLEHQLRRAAAGMLSRKGRCATFSDE